MPPPPPKRKKQATPLPPNDPALKKEFFMARSTQKKSGDEKKESAPQSSSRTPEPVKPHHQQYVKQRRFVYDEDTGEPYAEWIDGEAICLETGEVLFQSRARREEDNANVFPEKLMEINKFDFAIPAPGSRHPLDPAICSQDLIDTGVLSIDHFRAGAAGISFQVYNEIIAKRCRDAI